MPFAPPLKCTSIIESSSSLWPGDEGRHLGAQLVDLEAGDVSAQVLGVDADVAGAVGGPGLRGIHAPHVDPARPALDELREPALRVLDHDLVDPAELALGHAVAGLLHHRVAGVVVRQHECRARLLDQVAQRAGVVERGGHRLVAHDVEAVLDEAARDLVVVRGRDHDRDEVEPLAGGPLRLLLRHLAVAAVDPRGIEALRLAGLARLLGVAREAAGDELRLAVHRGGHPVHGADEGARRPSDHAAPEPAAVDVVAHDPASC